MTTKTKTSILNIRLALVLMAASATFLVAQDPPSRVGRLNYREGPVSFQPTGLNEWVDADINRPLTTGDNIWVGDRGRAEFHIGSIALRLNSQSDFQLLNLDDQTVQIRLSQGTLTVRVRNLDRGQIIEVNTPNLAFTVTQPGSYRIDVQPDSQTTTVTVRDGAGEVTGGGQSFPIHSRQRVIVRGLDQISYNFTSGDANDDFDQWYSARDRREDQSQSARYVSREIPGYDDFDQYGSWGQQPGYGQVWMPTTVAAGWAPYHDGHWAWIAPWGWTWVDDAPWGFAPYHYGRWASFGGRWGWIPGPYAVAPTYAPALVGWIGGGGSAFSLSFSVGVAPAIGWFPLGPREPYYPSHQMSQRYFTRVNRSNSNFNDNTLNNFYNRRNSNNSGMTYVNQRVQNGVTAVPQGSFSNGRRVNQEARSVPAAQLASAVVVASPSIAPQRSSLLGPQADKASRTASRRPDSILNRPVVARTAPPPAPVPFEQQRPVLDKNPGRPLPPAELRQLRQREPTAGTPVRIVDMGNVKRVQPSAVLEPQRREQQQQDNQRQQQQKQQQDNQLQQQQKQQQDSQRQQKQKQQQDNQLQQQQKQQQDNQRQQQQKQQQDNQRQQQQKQQQDNQRQQQQKPQQDNQRQQQQKPQQDNQRQQQQKPQQPSAPPA